MAGNLVYSRRALVAATAVVSAGESPRRLWRAWGVLLLLGFVARLAWGYDADELQNLHFAWSIGQGQLPFRDFFEHHPPLFHYALAPFVSGLDRPGWGLLVATRLAAVAVAALIVRLFHGLLLRSVNRQTAAFAVGALLVTYPFGTTIFELRADWFALAAVLAALGLLSDAFRSSRKLEALYAGAAAGLLTGLGIILTQKTALLLAGVGMWAVGCIAWSSSLVTRRCRVAAAAAFAGAAAIPLLSLAAWFAANGALGPFIEYTIRINFRWASEGTWRYTINESLPAVMPLAVLAAARLLDGPRRIVSGLRAASMESAAAFALAVGVAALLTTPVPHGQSYLFLVVPWAVLLAAGELERLSVDPAGLRARIPSFLLATGLCLAAASPVNAAASVVGWALVFAVCHRGLANRHTPSRRLAAVGTAMLAVGVVVYVGRAADALRRHEGLAQVAFIDAANRMAPPGTPVLETWPLVTPFRPQPSFHGFARRGPAQTIGVALLEEEYAEAIRSGRARFAVVDDNDIRRHLPRFAHYLDSQCRRERGAPATRDRLALYDCGK